ncbi:hypothetical protein, partial [Fusobacterium sp. PH5-44]|uniref:hypothetical protein n=1 Tax=unclassified Fusobacterium TaxID=2648384 RepID=UPI003D1AB91D
FGNVDNLLTGVVHEGGHGTYANAAIDEKAVGVLTGNYIFDKNKNIILSESLTSKVLNDTSQYFADRADGKLRDATGIFIVNGSGSAGASGGGVSYVTGITIFEKKYFLEGFVGESKSLSVNPSGLVTPGVGVSGAIGMGLYPFTRETGDYAGTGKSFYGQVSFASFFINASVSLPELKDVLTLEGWKGFGVEMIVGKDLSLGGGKLDFGVSFYDTKVDRSNNLLDNGKKAIQNYKNKKRNEIVNKELEKYRDPEDETDNWYSDKEEW